MAGNPGLAAALGALAGKKFDAAKHARGAGGKFTGMGGGAKKPGGAVATAHGIFDKLKGKSKAEMLAAAKAAGLNDNTAKTQLYYWQKKQAAAALGNNPNPTKEDLQAAAAKALGVKQNPYHTDLQPGYHSGTDGQLYKVHSGYAFHTSTTGYPSSAPAKPPTSAKYHGKLADGPEAKAAHDAHLSGKEPAAAPKSAAQLPVAEKPKVAGHYTGADGKLYYANANGKVYSTDAMTGQVKAEVQDPPAVDKLHGQVGLKKALEGHDAHLASAAKPAATEKPDLAKLGPTRYVHALADHMKGVEKKAVVAAAIAAGVNKSTAGVQYGKWAAKQAGTPPQLEKSPEPAALQAKQPQDMSDKQLNEALASYQGKISTPNPTDLYAPKLYKHHEDYHDSQGGKALTAKMAKGDVYTNKAQGKTFYKSHTGSIYEHVGVAGPMTKVAGDSPIQMHYDPATKIVHGKGPDGVLVPIKNNATPIFKNDQPYDPVDHVFKDDKWSSGTNGIQDPKFSPEGKGASSALKGVHAAAGVNYSESEAVASYTGSGYHDINSGLRGEITMPKWAQGYSDHIDSEMAKSSFKEDTIMWRGVGQGGTEWNGSPPPSTLVDKGFVSTSFKPSVARAFSDKKTLFRVKVPKGFPGLNVAIGQPAGGGVAGLDGEAEVMLPRGTTYKVVARHAAKGPTSGSRPGGMDVVDLEPQLPQWWIDKHGSAS